MLSLHFNIWIILLIFSQQSLEIPNAHLSIRTKKKQSQPFQFHALTFAYTDHCSETVLFLLDRSAMSGQNFTFISLFSPLPRLGKKISPQRDYQAVMELHTKQVVSFLTSRYIQSNQFWWGILYIKLTSSQRSKLFWSITTEQKQEKQSWRQKFGYDHEKINYWLQK